jgi:hypothetical protein
MRKTATLLFLATVFAVGACTRNRGDEFAVAKSAPLIVPPDFALAPPVTGTAGPAAGDAQQQAIDTLFGGPTPRTLIETSMLDVAGQSMVKLGIRSTVWDPDTRITDKGQSTIAILQAQPANSEIASAQPGQ